MNVCTPEQPGLAGIPPAPNQASQAAAAGEQIKCCFIGHLASAALVRDERGEFVVEVLLRQHVPRHPQALPVLAAWHYPGPAFGVDPLDTLHKCQALAATLPAGAEVVLLGRGLECSHHHGEPVLRVMDVLGIKPNPF